MLRFLSKTVELVIETLVYFNNMKHSGPRNKKCKQTRTDGKFNLQPQEILALCGEKTSYFDPSCIT